MIVQIRMPRNLTAEAKAKLRELEAFDPPDLRKDLS